MARNYDEVIKPVIAVPGSDLEKFQIAMEAYIKAEAEKYFPSSMSPDTSQ
jgi:hypothetical protein